MTLRFLMSVVVIVLKELPCDGGKKSIFVHLKAESSELHNAIELNALYMGRDRIYFALHSFPDKASFDDNAIWLLSEDIIFSISTERRPITADLMKGSACVCARWRACVRALPSTSCAHSWHPNGSCLLTAKTS